MDIRTLVSDRNSEEDFNDELINLLAAGAGIIHVRATEMLRGLHATRRALLLDPEMEVYEWDMVNGMERLTTEHIYAKRTEGDKEPQLHKAIEDHVVAKYQWWESGAASDADKLRSYSYIFFNPPGAAMQHPVFQQHLMELSHFLPATEIRIIFVTTDEPPPEAIAHTMVSIDFDRPGHGELVEHIDETLRDVEEVTIDMSEQQRAQLAVAGAGMTRADFEMALSRAVIDLCAEVEEGDEDPHVDPEAIIRYVSNMKTEIVKQNDLLELLQAESMSSVGGMEALKEWVRQRSECFSDEAREFGIEAPKGAVLVGVPGCLSGGTELIYKRGARSSGRPITLETLYHKFNGIPCSSRPWVDLTMPTFLHSLLPDGTVGYNRIVSVIDSGEKEVVEITTAGGREIRLTADHPMARPGGSFTPAGELRNGDAVLVRGSMLPVGQGGRRLDARPPRVIENVKYHPHAGGLKSVDGYLYSRVPRARLTVEAHMNGMDYDEFVHCLKHNRSAAEGLKFLPEGSEVHHIDEDTMNDELSNLMVFENSTGHARLHGKFENFNVEYVQEDIVESIVPGQPERTYDIQMESPANNFCANEFIVHNTGKSLAAKAVASEFGIPLLKLDFSNMFQSLVGSSEARMRTSLKMVESMAPCVLFADEIDKGLGGIGSGGDAGTSQRVLGTFLSWLQDNKAPVFTIVTANNVTGLPPELLRRGRFDATFSTMLPNEFEREDVFRIHLEKRNHSLEEFTEDEIVEFLSKTAGFVPAEIEAVVKDALILAFNDEPRELTMQHLLDAVADTVSLSASRSEEMDAMVKWAQENATPASWTAEDRAAKEARNERLTKDGKVRGRGTSTSGTGRPGGTVRNLQPSRRRKSPTKPKGSK